MASKLEQELLAPMANILSDLVMLDEQHSDDDSYMPKHFDEVAPMITQCAGAFINVAAGMSKRTKNPKLVEVLVEAVSKVQNSEAQMKAGLKSRSRRSFIDAVFAMVEGARSVLDCYDRCEIEKLVHACAFCIQSTEDYRTFDMEQEITESADILDQNYTITCKHARNRSKEIINCDLKDALVENVETIETCKPLLLAASVLRVKHPGDEIALNGALTQENIIVNALKEIIAIAESIPGVDNHDKLTGDLWNFMRAIAARLLYYKFSDEDVKRFRRDATKLIESADKFVEVCTDPLLVHRLTRDNEDLKNALEEMDKADFAYQKSTSPEERPGLQEILKGKFHAAQVCAAKLAANLQKLIGKQGIKAEPASVTMCRAAAAGLVNAAKIGDKAKFKIFQDQLEEEAQKLLEELEKAHEQTTDPENKAVLGNLIKTLPSYKTKLMEAALKVLDNPTAVNLAELDAMEKEWNEFLDQCRDALDKATPLSDKLKAARANIQELGVHAVKGYSSGDHMRAGRATEGIDAQVAEIQRYIEDEAATDEDKEYGRRLLQAAEKLQEEMRATSKAVIEGSSKPISGQHAAIIAGHVEALVDTIDIMIEDSEAREKARREEELRRIEAEKEAERLRIEAEKEAERLRIEAEKEAERQRKEAERLRMLEIQRQKEAEAQRLAALAEEARKAEIARLAAEAERKRIEEEARLAEEKRLAEIARIAEEKRKREEAERLAAEEAARLASMKRPDDAIKAAAFDLIQDTSKYGEDNEMVQAALEIARLLEMLADAAKSGDKKKMLEACKGLERYAKITNDHATKIADGCTDKRLQNSLRQESTTLPTISTQLRVIAAVKVGDPNQNPEGYQQLVVCAQNLAKGISSTVRQAEVASLRLTKVDGQASFTKWNQKNQQFLKENTVQKN